ncbi:MAG: alanine racemase [Vicinamibacterales bacterium]
MTFDAVATPALVLDVNTVRRNADAMRDRLHRLGCSIRPHIKTHKCVEIARMQVERPHGPITVSTLAEAHAFADEGYHDIVYAVPLEPGKFDAVFALTSRCRLAVLADDVDVVDELSTAAAVAGQVVDVLVKVDCGYHRCGVLPDTPEAMRLIERVDRARQLRFAGLLTHAGQSYACRTLDERRAVAAQERDAVVRLAARAAASGIEVPIVSVGSTPSLTAADNLDGVTEGRPGNYVLFDLSQVARGTCTMADCAVTLLASVVHRDLTTWRIVVDAGSLALSKDSGVTPTGETPQFGQICDLDGTPIGTALHYLAQEHGVFQCPSDYDIGRLRVGRRVRIIPNHACLTVAQHPRFHVLEGDRIREVWAIHAHWH